MKRWRTNVEDCCGFAIVLVAALGALVFLLGASLVLSLQLQNVSSQYNQRMHQAREHALAALEIAIADLQQYAGRDKSVTLLADALRSDGDRDFDNPSPASVSKILHPFWVGAYDPNGDGELRWLVTRPLESEGDAPSPFYRSPAESNNAPIIENDLIVLVGAGTALPESPSLQQDLFNVRVPRQPIVVSDVPGQSRDLTLGYVAYWIGDLGMKASYALRDTSNSVEFDLNVSNGAHARLRRMRASHADFALSRFDPNSAINAPRIDSMTNDFQFRAASYPTTDHESAYLDGLYLNSVIRKRFHDFTPLSRGLYTNTADGGLKKDFSARSPIGAALFDDTFLRYVNLPFDSTRFLGQVSAGDAIRAKFAIAPASGGAAPAPAIYPYLTQFNFNGSFYIVKREDGSVGDLKFSYNVSFEFWNPYTSTLQATPLKIVINGLPKALVRHAQHIDLNVQSFYLDLGDLGSFSDAPEAKPMFLANSSGDWLPGEMKYFSGPVEGASEYPLPLAPHSAAVVSTNRVVHQVLDENGNNATFVGLSDSSADTIGVSFAVPGGSETTPEPVTASPTVSLYAADADVQVDAPIVSFRLENHSFGLTAHFVSPYEVGTPSFGFTWEMGNLVGNPSGSVFPVFPINAGFHPGNPSAASSSALNLHSSARDLRNLSTTYRSIADSVFGFSPLGSLTNSSYDLPALELPRQEVVSLSNLANVYYSSGDWRPIGSAGAPANALLDKGFFSTIPQGANPEEENAAIGALPSPSARLAVDAIPGDANPTDTAQYLYQHGAFNVNSTSRHAWAAMLRGVKKEPLQTVSLVDSVLQLLDLAPGDGEHVFYNYPQSAGETYFLDSSLLSGLLDLLGLGDEGSMLLRSQRRGVVSLTKAQVDGLAVAIVEEIRAWQRDAQRPFQSLREFLDAGVLEKAIAAMEGRAENDPLRINVDVFPGSPSALQPHSILNAIEPFLSARSDTFQVRAYGDAVNPADPDEVWARAYCEAVVQRTHAKHSSDKNPGVMSPTSAGAGEFGREFRIISFRWLSPEEI